MRFGDEVKKGQLLAVVWSRELGEKKSELSEALSTLAFDRETLLRLSRNEAAVPINSVREAERRVRAGEIAVERIEKTLRSWQLSPAEIQQLTADIAHSNRGDDERNLSQSNVDKWARVEIRSPIDGTIVEKNITIGALVDQDDSLFKIANMDHLDVRAFAYEEDLVSLQRLSADERKWSIHLKGDNSSPPIVGSFDRIGSLIDPLQHIGIVMGWVDNTQRAYRAGQFITATVSLPQSQPLLQVPAQAVVDVEGSSYVLLQLNDPAQFLPVKVSVSRFDGANALIEARTSNSDAPELRVGSTVVASGAVELMAEYREHFHTLTSSQKARISSDVASHP